MIDVENSLLYDFYGKLLTEKQRDIMHMHLENDYSLTEIAEELKISRQAVYDSVKKTKNALQEYENKLGLVEKFVKTQDGLENIKKIMIELKSIVDDNEDGKKLFSDIEKIMLDIEQIEVK